MSKELRIEFVDRLRTNIKINTEVLTGEQLKEKYNRAKKKEEERKMAEEYLDR